MDCPMCGYPMQGELEDKWFCLRCYHSIPKHASSVKTAARSARVRVEERDAELDAWHKWEEI